MRLRPDAASACPPLGRQMTIQFGTAYPDGGNARTLRLAEK